MKAEGLAVSQHHGWRYRDITHPMRKDVKRKFFSLPPGRREFGDLHPALPPS